MSRVSASRRSKRALVASGVVGAAGALAWAGWATERSAARRFRAEESALIRAGLAMPSEVEHRFVTTSDGARIHVIDAGTGPAIVLIHGITLSSSIFVPVIRLMSSSHWVVAIDLRGHGASVVGDDGVGFSRQAKDLEEVFDSLAINKAVLVGHSMGGMIAQAWMTAPDMESSAAVSHLVLLDTSTGPLSTSRAGRRFSSALTSLATKSVRRRAKSGGGLFPGEDAGTWLTRASFGRQPEPAQIELTRSLTQATSPLLVESLLDPLFAFDGRDGLSSIDVPVTVVVGSRDHLTPVRQSRRLVDGIANSHLVIVRDAGHMVMLEDPVALCAVLEVAAAGVG